MSICTYYGIKLGGCIKTYYRYYSIPSLEGIFTSIHPSHGRARSFQHLSPAAQRAISMLDPFGTFHTWSKLSYNPLIDEFPPYQPSCYWATLIFGDPLNSISC